MASRRPSGRRRALAHSARPDHLGRALGGVRRAGDPGRAAGREQAGELGGGLREPDRPRLHGRRGTGGAIRVGVHVLQRVHLPGEGVRGRARRGSGGRTAAGGKPKAADCVARGYHGARVLHGRLGDVRLLQGDDQVRGQRPGGERDRPGVDMDLRLSQAGRAEPRARASARQARAVPCHVRRRASRLRTGGARDRDGREPR